MSAKHYWPLIAALAFCNPAVAQVYGPPAPVESDPLERADFEAEDGETLDQAEARLRRDARTAWSRFWIGQGLAAADLTLTCVALGQRNADGTRRFREGNPIYGKNANCGRIIAIRGGLSVAQYFIARSAIRRDPTKAKKAMIISIAIQGVPVVWNAVQMAR